MFLPPAKGVFIHKPTNMMFKKLSILGAALLLLQGLSAQLPYTQKLYGVRVDTGLFYGSAVNYAGIEIPLSLDLYKPVGDGNQHRPLAVLVHGGAWLTGCSAQEKTLAEELAQRGYVVAAVNYRKGWHKDDYVPNPANAPVYPDGPGLYPADSSEIIRALYRGQQDVKAAIRWLKARAKEDSICNQAVIVSGESAGGFIALAVGLLDRLQEKPDACHALLNAPTPGANLVNFYDDGNCKRQVILPAGADLQRPDLGPVDGDLNINGFNSDVIGIGSFFGAVPYEALTKDWIQGPDTPAVYLFHQTCDGIVPFGYGVPFVTLSAYCNLGFTPWHYNNPHTFGNGSIAAYLEAMPNPPLYTTDFVECAPFDPNLALFECVRYAQNGAYHFAPNLPERMQKFADFFSPVVTAKINSTCAIAGSHEPGGLSMKIFPNMITDHFSVQVGEQALPGSHLALRDMSGRMVWENTQNLAPGLNPVTLGKTLRSGLYVLEIRTERGVQVFKVVCP